MLCLFGGVSSCCVLMVMSARKSKPLLGWREWVGLPGLGVERIMAKVDTGALTSALDTALVDEFEENGVWRVRFKLFTGQGECGDGRLCVADVRGKREVTNSGGNTEDRTVIRTPVVIGGVRKAIEITLTDRHAMEYRMLLGRTAIRREFNVNPARSWLAGEPRVEGVGR